MKFRTGLLLGLGVGFLVGRRLLRELRADDPNVVKGPREEEASRNRAGIRIMTDRATRLTDQATVRSLDAIRKTRTAIQRRLYEPDDAAWR